MLPRVGRPPTKAKRAAKRYWPLGAAATGGIPGRNHPVGLRICLPAAHGKNHAKPRLENSLIGAMAGPDVFADTVRT